MVLDTVERPMGNSDFQNRSDFTSSRNNQSSHYHREKRLLYFDMNVVHQRDYASFRLPIEDYLQRYFIGHYNPTGNHFFAYSIKNTIVDWLTPEPQTYRKGTQKAFDYSGYLPE